MTHIAFKSRDEPSMFRGCTGRVCALRALYLSGTFCAIPVLCALQRGCPGVCVILIGLAWARERLFVSPIEKRARPHAGISLAGKTGLLGFRYARHAERGFLGIKMATVISSGLRALFPLGGFPDTGISAPRDPARVVEAVRFMLFQPKETVLSGIMVLPMRATSWL